MLWKVQVHEAKYSEHPWVCESRKTKYLSNINVSISKLNVWLSEILLSITHTFKFWMWLFNLTDWDSIAACAVTEQFHNILCVLLVFGQTDWLDKLSVSADHDFHLITNVH